MGLLERAAVAFAQRGEDAYWDTLATEPASQPNKATPKRVVGTGYDDNKENRDTSGLYAVDSHLKRVG